MGLSASMWTSVSGLLSHGNKMNVVGNNIANVSTIGFKSQRMDFNDYLYINGGSTSGPTQIGAGVATYAVIGDFSQGSLESTNSVTDIAIDGEGFFKVRKPNTDQVYYTRAGDFFFNADRQLQNPEGYYLQGWKIDNSTRLTFKSDSVNLGENTANESAFKGTGTPVDIVLDSWYLEPQRTSSVSFTMGLTSDGSGDRSTSTTSPMTALFDQWDASKQPPMADTAYATLSPIKVFDEGGNPHTLTVYYDQVATQAKDAEGHLLYSIDGLPAGYTIYEYCVTIPPEEDMRSYSGTGFNEETNEFEDSQPTRFYNDPVKGTNKKAGMLMTGHLIFDAAGNLVNQTAYTYGANADIPDRDQCSLDPSQLGSWQATKFSSNGLPVFCANFTGQPLANSVNERLSATQSQAQDYLIELDFGLRTAGEWTYTGSLDDLVGDIEPPATNTETRVSLATSTRYLPVDFNPDGDTSTGGKAAMWEVKNFDDGQIPPNLVAGEDDDGNLLPVQMQDDYAKVSESPSIFVKLLDGTRVQIDYDKKGPMVCYANGDNGKTMTVAEFNAFQNAEATARTALANAEQALNNAGANPPNLAELQKAVDDARASLNAAIEKTDGFVQALLGTDGKPIRYSSGNKGLVPVSFDDAGVLTAVEGSDPKFLWERNLKTIPNSYLTGNYQQVVNGEMVDIDFSDEVYALSDGGEKLGILFDDTTGMVYGTYRPYDDGPDGPNTIIEDYKGEKIYFDKAVAARTIDYNKDVSTYDDPIRTENATQAGSSSYVIQDSDQNGYTSGVLSGTNITTDGVVYGYYDNGETVPLYQIALYDFHNKQGLRREGGNLYGQTKESGEARQGVAGENGFGVTRAYNIEASNVDLSREFVNMISTQRGFQANSKGITTVDTMLETVIGMKR